MVDGTVAGDELAAGRAALSRGDWYRARSLLEAAVAAGGGPEALEDLSWAAWWLEDADACLDARERAYRGYREQGQLRAAARMALWLGDDHAELRQAHAVGAGWLARAARILERLEPSPEHGWLTVFEAHAALERHDLAAARRLSQRAQELGRRHGAVDLEMFAVATEGVARVRQGALVEGLRLLDEASVAALGGEYETLAPAAWTCCLMMSTCQEVRDYERAGQWCRLVEAFSEKMNARFLRGVCRTHYGTVQAWRGDWRAAEQALIDALETLGEQRPTWRADALVQLGELRRRQGRLEDAATLFEQAEAHPLALRGTAAVDLERGDASAARDLLERSLRQLPGGSLERAEVLELLVRAHAALGEHDSAAVRLEELRTLAVTAGTAPLQAAVDRCAGVVAAAAGEHERACDRFEDAVDRLTRSGAPIEAAAARIALAEAFMNLGSYTAARREARLAWSVLDGLDAAERARAAAIIEALDEPAEAEDDEAPALTPRQLQVLRLVAQGRSDQQIADQLVLSPHTVHRHVANIYTRLTCSSRAEAVAKAGHLGLL